MPHVGPAVRCVARAVYRCIIANAHASHFQTPTMAKFDTSTPLGRHVNTDNVPLLPVNALVTPDARGPHPILKTSPARQNFTPARRVLFSPTAEVMCFTEDSCAEDLTQKEAQHHPTGREPRLAWRRVLSDPTIPYMILLYLQLFLNIVLVAVLIYVGYSFISSVRSDIGHKVDMYTLDAVREILRCLREFYRNKCAVELRAPALELRCVQWEKCMNRDPQQLGRAQISAETLADVVNGFVRPLSWKLVAVFVLATGGSFGAVNFGMARCRVAAQAQGAQSSLQPANPQATRPRLQAAEKSYSSGRAPLMYEDSPLQDRAARAR